MGLLEHYLNDERERMMKNEVRLLAIGDRDRLPRSVRKVLDQTIEMTKDNAKITVTLALSYSGRHDIVKMVQGIAKEVKEGSCRPEDIDETMISAYTETGTIPDPDLLIRTSGEMRISNFFLWQIPYTELYVTPTLWPDFRQQQYIQALVEFQKRRRRFGKTDEQAN
jgi:undecaprenyl diphosphate synthase